MWPVCFIKHLDKLAEEFLKAPAPRKWRDALQNYSDGVLADTTTWISLGIKDYYLSIPKDVLRAVFKPLVKEALAKRIRISTFPAKFGSE